MSKLNIIRKCYGCGEILQTEDPNKPGFIDKETLDNSSRITLCQKCYNKENYDIVPNKINISEAFDVILKDARATDALIIYMLDVFSFEAAFSKELNDRLSGFNIIVVATKRDLLPKNVDDKVIKEDIVHRLRREGITVKDVFLTSSTTDFNIKEIIKKINEIREGHDVYVVGGNGMGKTYFINAYLKNYKNPTIRPVKTMEYPGTSLNVMQIPLDKNSTLYDTDGIEIINSIYSFVEKEVARIIVPKKEVNRNRIKMRPNDALFVGNIARFDFVKGSTTFVDCYFSSKIEVKKVTSHIDETFSKRLKKKKGYPFSKNFNSLADFNAFEINISENEDRDIGIQGLGWFSFKGNKQLFRVFVPKGVGVYSCRAKIPYVK